MRILLVDKTFYPRPYPRKHRYEILSDLKNISEIMVLFSRRNEYNNRLIKSWNKNEQGKFIFFPCFSFGKGFIRYLTFLISSFVRGLFIAKKIDIIIASCPDPLQSFSALLLSRIKKTKFIIDFRDEWPELLIHYGYLTKNSIITRGIFILTKILINYSDGIIGVTEDIYGYLDSRTKKDKPIFIRDNISNPDEIKNSLNDKQQSDGQIKEILKIIKKYKINSKKLIALSGRPNWTSNIEEKLLFLINIIKEYKGISIHIFSNSKEYDIFTKYLTDHRNIYKWGSLTQNLYYKILNCMDFLLFINDSGINFSSNKIYDALMVGVPVIALVKKDVNIQLPGVFKIDIDNYDAIKKSFKSIINDNDSIKKENLIIFYKQKYQQQVDELNSFLLEIAKSKN